MRRSHYFLPTLRDIPAEAQIVSHRLMLRCGMIQPHTSGIYSWLPLGLRVLQKIEAIVAREQDRVNVHRILMPTIQSADLWRESGRYDDYGKEMLRIKDRHERDLLYGPTHEEVVTDIARHFVKSYRQLPLALYQISWKFRDEMRPRFGVMRGREFLMKDGYSFDRDYEGARQTYEKIFSAYLRTYRSMGLTPIPVRAHSGAIGGELSHEFHIRAETGESALYYDACYDQLGDDALDFPTFNTLYAATDEKHDPATCSVPEERLKVVRGIEVGHIFYFGTKYSKAMNMAVTGPDGEVFFPEMGSYGIGVSRLAGAIIEAHHDEAGIIWPESVAPFDVGLILAKQENEALAEDAYAQLSRAGMDVLFDDREERPGVKFADMDLIGIPWQVIIGKTTESLERVEVKCRKTNHRFSMSLSQFIESWRAKTLA